MFDGVVTFTAEHQRRISRAVDSLELTFAGRGRGGPTAGAAQAAVVT
jgi:hypothetical protein